MNRLFQQYAGNLTTTIIVILFCTGLWQLTSAGWIQAKAIIAQQLLKHSWHKTLIETTGKNTQHKPWPWADTWPIAKLIVPQHDIEQIILAGDSGSTLAFGPGHSLASEAPNTIGLTMISAHRDTHFSFLENIKTGDEIYLQTPGKNIMYHVYDIKIVDSKTFNLQQLNDEKTLVLVTCFPFNAIMAGSSLRYLVYANTQTTQNKTYLQTTGSIY